MGQAPSLREDELTASPKDALIRSPSSRLVRAYRFAATNGDGSLSDAHVFHAHRCIPFEHLFVSVLGLILGRIPVEGVEHAGFRIFLPVHRKHVMNNARGW